MSNSKIDTSLKMSIPVNVSEGRSFCGLINYYQTHIKNLSSILHPIYQLKNKGAIFCWTKAHDEAFKKSKDKLIDNVTLAHFDPINPIILATDASEKGINRSRSLIKLVENKRDLLPLPLEASLPAKKDTL